MLESQSRRRNQEVFRSHQLTHTHTRSRVSIFMQILIDWPRKLTSHKKICVCSSSRKKEPKKIRRDEKRVLWLKCRLRTSPRGGHSGIFLNFNSWVFLLKLQPPWQNIYDLNFLKLFNFLKYFSPKSPTPCQHKWWLVSPLSLGETNNEVIYNSLTAKHEIGEWTNVFIIT